MVTAIRAGIGLEATELSLLLLRCWFCILITIFTIVEYYILLNFMQVHAVIE
jgi:hypothetical protein